MTPHTDTALLAHVFTRLREVQETLGIVATLSDDPGQLLSDLLDSMGLVELIGVLARDRGVTTEAVERAAERRFSSVAHLADALERASPSAVPHVASVVEQSQVAGWLSSPICYIPQVVEEAAELDRRLARPVGWLESHAGIKRRHVWGTEDAVEAAACVALESLSAAGLLGEELGGLLVTSQAPPLLAGLAATLHRRLDLPPRTVALEVGGACAGFLQALWLAHSLIDRLDAVLIVAVEAPSRHLVVEAGEAGEAAALFGDGVAACLITRESASSALPLRDVELSVADNPGLLSVEGDGRSGVRLRMDGPRLAARAIEALAETIEALVQRHRLSVNDLSSVVVHGGNGRLPALVARRLGLSAEKVWSLTSEAGNLGSASLPAAWARAGVLRSPVAWAAVGAGLVLGAALT